jgi:hypothetical protein
MNMTTLIIVKSIAFLFCIGSSVNGLLQLYLAGIKAYGDIQFYKKYQISIAPTFSWSIIFTWTIFYFLCQLK